jgi:hypothetical protein
MRAGPSIEIDLFSSNDGPTLDVDFEVIGGVQRGNVGHKAGGATAFFDYSVLQDYIRASVENVDFVDNIGHSSGGVCFHIFLARFLFQCS